MHGNDSEAPDNVIEIRGVTRRFGAKRALDNVSLAVPRGVVFGLVGANGAGKTTLIRHVLGLLKAQTGSVRVFGLDPVKEPVGVLSRIGYLSEEGDLPGWMRVDELMRYMRAFYPTWDEAYAQDLRQQFALDPAAKVKTLSKGQKARAGLLVALAYRPELLLLDEPSSGLDPIVRRDILGRDRPHDRRRRPHGAVLVALARRGRTHFRPRRDAQGGPHSLHRRARRNQADAPSPDAPLRRRATPAAAARWRLELGRPRLQWTAVACGRLDDLTLAASAVGAEVVEQKALSLDEIFLAQVGSPSTVAEGVAS